VRHGTYNDRLGILIGLIIGLVIGSTGLGGGVLTAPILILFMGLSPAESVGTALVFSAAAKVSGALVYLNRGQVDFRVLGHLLAGGVPGAAVGALSLGRIPAAGSNGVVLIIIGAAVVASAGFSLFGRRGELAPRVPRPGLLPVLSFPVGVGAGFSSAGAGALGTLLLFSFTNLTPAVVVGTDLVFGMAVSAVGGGLHAAAGSWNGGLLLKLAGGGVVGAAAGSHLAAAIPARVLRTVVLAAAMLLGFLLLERGLEGAW